MLYLAPTPSPVFQEHIAAVLTSEEVLASSFLNSILNQLNWAFSEFIGMLQEVWKYGLKMHLFCNFNVLYWTD